MPVKSIVALLCTSLLVIVVNFVLLEQTEYKLILTTKTSDNGVHILGGLADEHLVGVNASTSSKNGEDEETTTILEESLRALHHKSDHLRGSLDKVQATIDQLDKQLTQFIANKPAVTASNEKKKWAKSSNNKNGKISNNESNKKKKWTKSSDKKNDKPSNNKDLAQTGLRKNLISLWGQLIQETPKGVAGEKRIINLKPRRKTNTTSNKEIVLVTHGSVYKLDTFLTELDFWQGPASIALHLDRYHGGMPFLVLERFLEDNKEALHDTAVHLLMETGINGYPHNTLRNMAIDYSDADYVLALDVDFIPAPRNTYAKLKETLFAQIAGVNMTTAERMRHDRQVMVLPAFEVEKEINITQATPDLLPLTKDELSSRVENKSVTCFHLDYYPLGHGPTNYSKWFGGRYSNDQEKDGNMPFYGIDYKEGFEPYVLAYRHGLPRYWETFRGYGFNKITWLMELQRDGYSFGVLWDFWVTHLQHEKAIKSPFNKNQKLAAEFNDYLEQRYPHASPTNQSTWPYTIEKQETNKTLVSPSVQVASSHSE